jgi:DNA-binding response OmpR family regulator
LLRECVEVPFHVRRNSFGVDVRARPRILLITDDPTFEQFINWLLHEREFFVRTTRPNTALSVLKATEPNAVLLEIAPTVERTAAAVKQLRTVFGAPIITVGTNESPYEIKLLHEAGIDDHLVAHERWTIVQCMRQCLRMMPAAGRMAKRFPVLELDDSRMRALLRGLPIGLSSIEYTLLARLMRRPYCIVSSAELLHEIRQHHKAVAAHTIRASIHHLRRKVEDDPRRPQRLVTVLGSGYVFRPDA